MSPINFQIFEAIHGNNSKVAKLKKSLTLFSKSLPTSETKTIITQFALFSNPDWIERRAHKELSKQVSIGDKLLTDKSPCLIPCQIALTMTIHIRGFVRSIHHYQRTM